MSVVNAHAKPITLSCPKCQSPCFPSKTGLWVGGSRKECECGARLWLGIDAEGLVKVRVALPEPAD